MKLPVSPNISPPGGWRYRQEETGMAFHTTGINALRQKVYIHRAANKLDTSVGWDDRLLEELCEQMPDLKCEEVPRPEDHPMVIAGRAHWKLLHDYALAYPEAPTAAETEQARQWFNNWVATIPQYGCSCKKKFQPLLEARPPDYRTRDTFYWWTVAIHNDVRSKLGQPIWSPPD